ncbi:MAG: DNA cytosine methyltransferase [Microthrixaceae bacterium]|nr:DNA cytosine methyltransferase [Microthrixaceae bacterium]
MRGISLFSGAGGLDLGCEAAGFETVAAVELDGVARTTMLANRDVYFPTLDDEAIFSDVTKTQPERMLDAAGLDVGEVELLHGGPPCTPFSKSGYWLEYKRQGADPKASLLDEYVRMLAGIRPKAFLMENVYGLAYRNQNRAVFERFAEGVRSAGYSFDHRVLLAADYGVPQLRQRLICAGLRKDLLNAAPEAWRFTWPEPTHSGPHETRKGWDESLPLHRTTSEALVGLSASENPAEPEEIVEGTYAIELRAVPPGDNYLWWTAERGHPHPRFKWRSRYWSFLLKLDPNRPAPTIQGQPGPWVGPFHWESRRLRTAEVKRLMTFPDDFVVLGTRREQQLQLGNAVPPLLAETVVRAIAAELRAQRAVEDELLVPAQ